MQQTVPELISDWMSVLFRVVLEHCLSSFEGMATQLATFGPKTEQAMHLTQIKHLLNEAMPRVLLANIIDMVSC